MLLSLANDLKGNADIYDMLIDKQNTSQYHNFAVMGGSVNSNYRASLYYNDAVKELLSRTVVINMVEG